MYSKHDHPEKRTIKDRNIERKNLRRIYGPAKDNKNRKNRKMFELETLEYIDLDGLKIIRREKM